uniref:Putative secreted protein n=1 Tax=Anopheles marajoara TaxID=58244 RepID=A0A2M4C606_9DIPT
MGRSVLLAVQTLLTLDRLLLGGTQLVVLGRSLLIILPIVDNRCQTLFQHRFRNIQVTETHGVRVLLRVVITSGCHVVQGTLYLLADQLLAQEFAGLEHPGNVVERAGVLRAHTVLLLRARWPNRREEHLLRDVRSGHLHRDRVPIEHLHHRAVQLLVLGVGKGRRWLVVAPQP